MESCLEDSTTRYAHSPLSRSPCSKSITDNPMRRICSFTDFYSVLLDFLRLSGAMILTDYLLLESIQHRIGANKIRVRFTTEFFFEHGFIGFNGYLLRSRYCQQIFYTSPRQWGLRDYSRICRKTFGDLVRILGKNIQIKDEPNLSVGTNAYTF